MSWLGCFSERRIERMKGLMNVFYFTLVVLKLWTIVKLLKVRLSTGNVV